MKVIRKTRKRLIGIWRELLVGILLVLIVGASAPWWIKLIPWKRIIPFHIEWKQMVVTFLPGDFEINVADPYNRPNVTPVKVLVEVNSGSVILLRKGEILEENIDKDWFVSEALQRPVNIELLRVTPQDVTVGNGRKNSSILLEFNSSSLIPRASNIVSFRRGDKHKFGELKVKLYYEGSDRALSKEVIIPMYLVHNQSLR